MATKKKSEVETLTEKLCFTKKVGWDGITKSTEKQIFQIGMGKEQIADSVLLMVTNFFNKKLSNEN